MFYVQKTKCTSWMFKNSLDLLKTNKFTFTICSHWSAQIPSTGEPVSSVTLHTLYRLKAPDYKPVLNLDLAGIQGYTIYGLAIPLRKKCNIWYSHLPRWFAVSSIQINAMTHLLKRYKIIWRNVTFYKVTRHSIKNHILVDYWNQFWY